MTNPITKRAEAENVPQIATPQRIAPMSIFSSPEEFNSAYKMATILSRSQMIPQAYQNKPQDCLIAVDMARRIGVSPFMVMQNLDVIYGRPSWRSQYTISCFNACGRFSSMRYEQVGEKGKDNYGFYAWAIERSTGLKIQGTPVTMAMAKAEGWYSKNGSKWKTMPDLMLQYRAAAFMVRTHAPELLNGMLTSDEVIDITPVMPDNQSETAIPADLSVGTCDLSGSTETPLKNAVESETAMEHHDEPPTESEMQLEAEEQK